MTDKLLVKKMYKLNNHIEIESVYPIELLLMIQFHIENLIELIGQQLYHHRKHIPDI